MPDSDMCNEAILGCGRHVKTESVPGGWAVAGLWHGMVQPGVTFHACLGEIDALTGIHGLIESLGKAVDVKYSV